MVERTNVSRDIVNTSNAKTLSDLQGRILDSIHRAEKRRYQLRLFFSVSILTISAAAWAFTAVWLVRDLIQSGFLETASLLFSDAGTVSLYWRDFLASLLEFLPFASLTACLVSVSIMLLSISYSAKYFHSFQDFRHGRIRYAVAAN